MALSITVPCPVCGRGVNEVCMTPKGIARWGDPHKARKILANAKEANDKAVAAFLKLTPAVVVEVPKPTDPSPEACLMIEMVIEAAQDVITTRECTSNNPEASEERLVVSRDNLRKYIAQLEGKSNG